MPASTELSCRTMGLYWEDVILRSLSTGGKDLSKDELSSKKEGGGTMMGKCLCKVVLERCH